MVSPSLSEWDTLCTKLFLHNRSLSLLGLIFSLLVRALVYSKFIELTDDSHFPAVAPQVNVCLWSQRTLLILCCWFVASVQDMRFFFVVLYDSTPLRALNFWSHMSQNMYRCDA